MFKEKVLRELEDEHCHIHSFSNAKFSFIVYNEMVHYYCVNKDHSIELSCKIGSKSPKVIKRTEQLTENLKEMIIHKSSKRLMFLCENTQVVVKNDNPMLRTTSDNAFFSLIAAVLLTLLGSSHFFVPIFENHFLYSLLGLWALLWIVFIFIVEDIKNNLFFNIVFTLLFSLSFSFSVLMLLWVAHYIPLMFYAPLVILLMIYGLYNFYHSKRLSHLIK